MSAVVKLIVTSVFVSIVEPSGVKITPLSDSIIEFPVPPAINESLESIILLPRPAVIEHLSESSTTFILPAEMQESKEPLTSLFLPARIATPVPVKLLSCPPKRVA